MSKINKNVIAQVAKNTRDSDFLHSVRGLDYLTPDIALNPHTRSDTLHDIAKRFVDSNPDFWAPHTYKEPLGVAVVSMLYGHYYSTHRARNVAKWSHPNISELTHKLVDDTLTNSGYLDRGSNKSKGDFDSVSHLQDFMSKRGYSFHELRSMPGRYRVVSIFHGPSHNILIPLEFTGQVQVNRSFTAPGESRISVSPSKVKANFLKSMYSDPGRDRHLSEYLDFDRHLDRVRV